MDKVFLLILSFAGLFWSANHLVKGASGIAYYFRISPLWIGLTLVALSTTASEVIIAFNGSLERLTDMALGNAVGINIANIGLVFGYIALIKPIKVQSSLLRLEFPLLFLIMLFTYSLMLDSYFGILDTCLFLLFCLGFLGYLLLQARQNLLTTKIELDFQQARFGKGSLKFHMTSFIIGLIILPISTNYLVHSSALLVHGLGVRYSIIALTLVAFGTGTPALITSLIAATKGADDIAIGNILGINILNLITLILFPSLIHPAVMTHAILWRDIPVMVATILILLWINHRNKQKIARWHGALLILVYCCYIFSILMGAWY